MGKKVVYEKDGKEQIFKSAQALCLSLDIDYIRFTRAIRSGKTVEDAIYFCKQPVKKNKNPVYSVRKSYNEMGKSYDKYYRLRMKGYSNKEAFAKAVKEDRTLEYQNITYSNMSAMCQALNLNYAKFRRLRSKGTPIEEAVELSKAENMKPFACPIRINGVEYPSMRAYCKEHEIPLSTLQYQLKTGAVKPDE